VSPDLHERARQLIALSNDVSAAERIWLAAHLESCLSCREFAESTAETIRSLRAIPITVSGSLLAATRMRIRQRTLQLQRRQERLHAICVCAVAVTLCTAFNTALLWGGSAWLSQRVSLSTPLFGLAFVALCLTPAISAGIILLARGSQTDQNGSLELRRY
jgi:predicted anti-sigma-YlaC factor YlaD